MNTASRLRRGEARSCGCLKRELISTLNRTHGQTIGPNGGNHPTPEYQAWAEIKKRCYNSKSKAFRYYGGRGIAMDDRWRDDPAQFIADMGPRPSAQHSIDRKNNDGPYSPDNCRWATRIEQARNKRSNRYFTYGGRTMTMAEWAHERGINYGTLYSRLVRDQWPIEKALHR